MLDDATDIMPGDTFEFRGTTYTITEVAINSILFTPDLVDAASVNNSFTITGTRVPVSYSIS